LPDLEKVKVLIADDHALIREGLRKILSTDPRIEVVAEADDGEKTIEYAVKFNPDIILMDINMPKTNGISATKTIKKEKPQIGIIALTIHNQEEYLFELINAGISGYLLKDISPDLLIETIIGVSKGNSFIHPSMTTKVFTEFNRLSHLISSQNQPDGLTKREMEVLKLIAHGDNNRSIAQKLYLSEKTVKNHITSIFQKIGVIDRTQAALYAIKNKLAEIS